MLTGKYLYLIHRSFTLKYNLDKIHICEIRFYLTNFYMLLHVSGLKNLLLGHVANHVDEIGCARNPLQLLAARGLICVLQ